MSLTFSLLCHILHLEDVYSIHDNTAYHSNSMRLSIHLEQAHLVGPFSMRKMSVHT